MGEGWLPPRPGGSEPEIAPAPEADPEPQPAETGWTAPAEARPGEAPVAEPEEAPSGQESWAYPARRATTEPTSSPSNNLAVTSFALSIASVALLVFFVGILWPVSLVTAILGIVFGRRAMAAIDPLDRVKNDGLAKPGFIIGIVALVLALATMGACGYEIANGDWHWDDNNDSTNGLNSVVTIFRTLAR